MTMPTCSPMPNDRSSGVLLHVTSLPGPYGIGDLGPVARQWIDAMADGGLSWWQTLPLVATAIGESPYFGLSSFAANPLLVSPDDLATKGLVDRRALAACRVPPGNMRAKRVRQMKTNLLANAFDRFRSGRTARELADNFQRFRHAHQFWLEDFTLFMALRDRYADRAWTDWPDDFVHREPTAIEAARRELADDVDRHAFAQFLVDRQLTALHEHARAKGVKLIGDLAIFVSPDSADVWARPELFQLDHHHRPIAVAGVPPDAFAADGQRWGNPLYDWNAMASDGYAWWVARLRAALRQADVVRLDHFRGFESYWRIPASSPTASKGRWTPGPRHALFDALQKAIGHLPLIAEDLGIITPAVEALRDAYALPGMRVAQFGFSDDADPTSPHLPHNYPPGCVAYTGTHDNDTTAGWFTTLRGGARKHFRAYAPRVRSTAGAVDELTRLVFASPARLAIVPMQDALALPSSARMNHPGTTDGNWQWRLADFATARRGLRCLGQLTATYGRSPQ
jgi:4-alpha-glucanotransferase